MRWLLLALLAGCLGKVPYGPPPPDVGIVITAQAVEERPPGPRENGGATGVLAEHHLEGLLAVVDPAGERVAVIHGDALPAARLGQEVVVQVKRGDERWGGPTDHSASVWDSDGTLLFATASGLHINSLGLPGGIELSSGRALRSVWHTCGRRRVRAVVVSSGGDRARVRPARPEVVGDYRVTVTTSTEQVGESRCSDWGGDAAVVWVVRVSPQ
jgi:hypothetical protein